MGKMPTDSLCKSSELKLHCFCLFDAYSMPKDMCSVGHLSFCISPIFKQRGQRLVLPQLSVTSVKYFMILSAFFFTFEFRADGTYGDVGTVQPITIFLRIVPHQVF